MHASQSYYDTLFAHYIQCTYEHSTLGYRHLYKELTSTLTNVKVNYQIASDE